MTVEKQTKRCSKCKQVKPVSEFPVYKGRINSHCFQCKRNYNRDFRKTAAGVYQQLKGRLNYEHNHPDKKNNWRHRRDNKKNLMCSREEFVNWYNSQPKICVYCGIPEEFLQKTKDPYNKGLVRFSVDCVDNNGNYSLDNMALCCRRCNHIKSDLFTFDEMKEIGKMVRTRWEKEFSNYLPSSAKEQSNSHNP